MKKEDFVVGRWYRNPEWSSPNDYVKYDGGDIKSDCIPFQESIYGNLYEKRASDWGCASSCIEVPISEIQQYLPDGHPDKMKSDDSRYWELTNSDGSDKFTAGQVYVLREGKDIDDNKAFIDNQGLPNGYAPNNRRRFIPSTKEKYDKQLIKQAATPFAQTIFNKGDYVVVTRNTSQDHYNGQVGFCYKCLSTVNELGKFKYESENGLMIGFNHTELDGRYATPDEIKEYEKRGELYDITTLNKIKPEPTRKFKLGKIQFKGCKAGDYIPTYFTNIPSGKLVYGFTIIGGDYEKEKAEIVDFHDEYYLVKYKCDSGSYVTLGFKEESLEEVDSEFVYGYEPMHDVDIICKDIAKHSPYAKDKVLDHMEPIIISSKNKKQKTIVL